MNILAIIPAYNEEQSIGSVVRRVMDQKVDVVVVNDGSRDRTEEAACGAGAVVLRLPFNMGIGCAVQTGYRYALRRGYDLAVQIDADGQHDPRDLMRLVEPIRTGEADFTIGSRYVRKSDYHTPVARRIGMIIFSFLVSMVTGQRITDTTSGYRAANTKVMEVFASSYPHDYPEVEALVIISRNGLRVKEVPVNMLDREEGKSSINFTRSIYYMLKVGLGVIMSALRKT